MALAAAEDFPSSRLEPELQMEALFAFCRENLHHADLSAQHAADHIGISVRTLHARFRQIDQTFGRWLLEQRLQGCRAALRDPRQRTRQISQIAYAWGFNDLSYFNRAFRRASRSRRATGARAPGAGCPCCSNKVGIDELDLDFALHLDAVHENADGREVGRGAGQRSCRRPAGIGET